MMKGKRKFTHFGAVPVVLAALITLMAATANAQMPANSATTPGQVTFTKDIVPILQVKCQTCHRDGAIAPMSLITYQETRPWAKDIKQRVLKRTMPPWFLDKAVGIQHYANDTSLSDDQIAMIAKWVDEGAPQGDPKDMPPPKVFEDDGGWLLAKILGRQPDMVLEAPDYTVKVGDQDQWFRPVTEVGLTEPRWVEAIEVRPSTKESRAIFHHITASLVQDETNAPSAGAKIIVYERRRALTPLDWRRATVNLWSMRLTRILIFSPTVRESCSCRVPGLRGSTIRIRQK